MPRKYNPRAFLEWEPGYDNPFPGCEMKEDPYGEWVKLKTFEDTTAMLIAANNRLQAELWKLKHPEGN